MTIQPANLRAAGEDLHRRSVIIDGLNVSSWEQDVFNGMKEGGLNAINATVVCWENFRQAMENLASWHRRFQQFSELITPVLTVNDIFRAKATGRIGIILGFQNLSPIEDDLNFLSLFHALGVRVMQLTFHARNLIGDSCSESQDVGLSLFGREVVREMNRLGLLIDVSHTSDRTTLEAIEVSEQPVAVTHANPRSMCNHPRNKPDEIIEALAKKGGVMGANIFPLFMPRGWEAKLGDFLDVIDYLVNLAGIDHVGIGTDFTDRRTEEWFHWLVTNRNPYRKPIVPNQWPYVYPEGFSKASEFPNVTCGLLERGYSETEVRKIMGENWVRLFREIWKPPVWNSGEEMLAL